MFYHGRRYSSYAPDLYAISMFKGQMDVFMALFFNYLSNFSTHSYFVGIPFALFHIIAANQNVLCWFLFDSGDIAYDNELYEKSTDLKVSRKYDPLRKGETCQVCTYLGGDIADHKGQVEKLGVPINTDGSANLLPEYYAYLRSKTDLLPVFSFYFPWSCLCAIISTVVISNSCAGIINAEGRTLDFLNMFLASWISNCLIFNISCFIETRAFPVFLVVLQIISLSLLPVVLVMTHNATGYEYYKSISDNFTPVYCLAIVLQVWIAVMPRFLFRLYRQLIARPEFSKVKDH
jgi:hypothetical protein